jgi:hypothetical protein
MGKYIKGMMLITIIAGLSFNLGAFHFANDMCGSFDEAYSASIEGYVIEGASLYFQASSDLMSFFHESEIGGKGIYNSQQALEYVSSAIERLQQSKGKYIEAALLGKTAGYNSASCRCLKEFGYDDFAQQRGMSSIVMGKVKGYLKNGNVIGFYNRVADDIEELTVRLNEVKGQLESGIAPEMPVLWELLQKFSDTTMFGNYATMSGQSAFGYY